MKILLLGEYSGLHLTLAEALIQMGHHVIIASDGDGFKNYRRDIDLYRHSSGLWDTLGGLKNIVNNLSEFKDFDIVQLINPCFTTQNIKINLQLFRYLKRHNKKVFLGAFGDDYYWLQSCLTNKFRYSEFNNGESEIINSYNKKVKKDWLSASRKEANIEMAEQSDGIIACLYEYYISYQSLYSEKLTYIPLPINTDIIQATDIAIENSIYFFIGINNARSEFKGTDILYKAIKELKKSHPKELEIINPTSIPYNEYLKEISNTHVVLDQIYSYSPAMNGLLTLALGRILISGGEPEMYNLLGEQQNRPIVNVLPTFEDIYSKLESILKNKETLSKQGINSRLFVEKHHNYKQVAQQYLDFWTK